MPNNVYTMRNFFEAEQMGRNAGLQERAIQQQNALQQMDPANLDPNKLWEAGQHEAAINLVQGKIDKSTADLSKVAQILQDNVTDQESYEKALGFIGQAFPEAGSILQKVPKQYDPQQVNMFISAAGQASATKPRLEVVRQPDGTMKVVDISRAVGQTVGGESAPPKTRTRISGGSEIQEEWNPQTQTWSQIGKGPRWDPNSGGVSPTTQGGWDRQDANRDERILAAREAMKTLTPMSANYGQVAQEAQMRTTEEKKRGAQAPAPQPKGGKPMIQMKQGADRSGYEKFRGLYNAAKGNVAEQKRLADIARKHGLID